MWANKKPEARQAAAPEPKNLLASENNTDGTRMLDATERGETGWLRPGLHIKGDITGSADLLIDGSVEGQIRLDECTLTVGPAARVTADILARDVVVYGYVKGNIRAKRRIEIKKPGSVVGNLATAQIMIEDGADFKGSIEIDRGGAAPKEAEQSVSSRAASASASASGSAGPGWKPRSNA